jgi:hypothetical protein
MPTGNPGLPSKQRGQIHDPNVDKDAIRLEFVTSQVPIAQLARDHGLRVTKLQRWARDEDWDSARKEYREKFLEQTTQSKIANAAARLTQWNEETMVHAGLLREAARRQFQYEAQEPGMMPQWRFKKDVSAKDISAAASAHVAADKLARLALGASTDNVNNVNKSLPATVDDFF